MAVHTVTHSNHGLSRIDAEYGTPLRQYCSSTSSKYNASRPVRLRICIEFRVTRLDTAQRAQNSASAPCPYYNVFPSVGGRTHSCRTQVGFNVVTFSKRESRGIRASWFRTVSRRTVNATGTTRHRFPHKREKNEEEKEENRIFLNSNT